MTEEIKQEVAPVESEQPNDPPQSPSIEERALEMGWRPREEFEGSDEDFIDAKEFVRRKPLFEKIESVSRESKTLRKALESLKSHYTKVREAEYQRALRDLKSAQKQALADGDVDRFYEIEDEQKLVEQEKAVFLEEQAQIQTQAPQVHPEFASWVSRNPWYETQPHMQAFADQVGSRLQGAVRAGNMTPAQVLKEIETAVRNEFPTRFRNPNKDKPGTVEGSVRTTTKSSEKEIQLSDEERHVMNTLVRGGHLTKEQYIADLKRAKEQK
jgi:hypothetical protein